MLQLNMCIGHSGGRARALVVPAVIWQVLVVTGTEESESPSHFLKGRRGKYFRIATK